MDVYRIVEGVIKNKRCSNNINDDNRVDVQPKYRFIDIAIEGGGNSSGSLITSTNGIIDYK